jgi:hypothetical protein
VDFVGKSRCKSCEESPAFYGRIEYDVVKTRDLHRPCSFVVLVLVTCIT